MIAKYKAPVYIQVYIGSGDKAEKLRNDLIQLAGPSLSKFIMNVLRKQIPDLFKGEKSGRK